MNIVRKINIWILTIGLLLSVGTLNAQRASSLRLSEIMVKNHNSIFDQQGRYIPWIEIYNSSSATVDLKGCYFTNDKNNLKKFRVALWSDRTKIGPRQYMVIWADGSSTLDHLNFTFDTDKENYLALVDADGKTIVDSVSIPVLDMNESYMAKQLAASIENNSDIEWTITNMPTPNEPNEPLHNSSKVEDLKAKDSNGLIMTVTAILVVFLSLLTLSIVFKFIGYLMTRPRKKSNLVNKVSNQKLGKEHEVAIMLALTQHLSNNDELIAAISMALSQESAQVHDTESLKLTIQHRPSSWNDRSFGFRKYNN